MDKEWKIIQKIIKEETFEAEFEPIVDIQKRVTVGYEGLSRFRYGKSRIPTNLGFEVLHHFPEALTEFEWKMKKFMLKERPQLGILFMNFDPHCFAGQTNQIHWKSLLDGKNNIVAEIIENTDYSSYDTTISGFQFIQSFKIPIALDDVGGKKNLFSLDYLEYCDYIKLDRYWFEMIHKDKANIQLLKGIVNYAKERSIKVLIEGVESLQQMNLAVSLGVNLAQGYYFKYGTLRSVA